MHAEIYIDTDGNTDIIEVEKVVSAGILVNDNSHGEINERLIPWHRVWNVTSKVEGELFLETGR